MPLLALLGGIYFLIVGITKKGSAYKSKIGTPLSLKEVKAVSVTYIVLGGILLIVVLVSGIDLIMEF